MKGERMTVAFFSAYDSYVPAFSGKKKESGLLIKFDNGPSYFRKFPLPADIRNADLGEVAKALSRFDAVQPFPGDHLLYTSNATLEEVVGRPIREAADLGAAFRTFTHAGKVEYRNVPTFSWSTEIGWYSRASPRMPSKLTESGIVIYETEEPPQIMPLFRHSKKGLRPIEAAPREVRAELGRAWTLLSTRRFDRMERQEDGTFTHVFYEPFHADNAKAVFAMLFPEAP